MKILLLLLLLNTAKSQQMQDTDIDVTDAEFTIEGKVYAPEIYDENCNWQEETQIIINSG